MTPPLNALGPALPCRTIGTMPLAAVVIATAGLAGCLSAAKPTATVHVYTAPVSAEVAAVRSIAVLPFEQDRGESFTRSVETSIASATLVDKNQNRQASMKVVGTDRTRGMSRSVGQGNFAGEATRQLGVDAVLAGEVVTASATSEPWSRTRSECASYRTEKDKKGKDVTVCANYRDVQVPCVKNVGAVAVNYRLLAADGQVLLRKTVNASGTDFACEGKRVRAPNASGFGLDPGGPVTSPAELLRRAFEQAAQQVRDQIAPGQKAIQVQWLADTAGIKSSAAKDKFEGALKFAGAGRPDRACEALREIYVSEQQSISLHHNVGLCDEIDGQVDAALKKYQIADRMLSAPHAGISASLARVKAQVSTIETIAERRPELLDAPAVPRTGERATVNPISGTRADIDPRILEAMKSERRVALVIGNGQYRHVAALRNATKDARDIEAALKAVGFNVISGFDLNHQQTLQLLNRFRANLRAGDVGLVYFAGHGISIDNSNLLLPIDFQAAHASDAAAARSNAIDMEQTLAPLLKGAGVRFSMVVADACREVPQLASSSRSIRRGLAAPKTVASGTLIVYAAGAGQTADDGAGDNGLFTANFLKAIRTPNVNIRQAMEWVAASVSSETGGKQIPSVYAELVGEFYFAVQ